MYMYVKIFIMAMSLPIRLNSSKQPLNRLRIIALIEKCFLRMSCIQITNSQFLSNKSTEIRGIKKYQEPD